MGLHHGVSPITLFCVHNISLYISNFFKQSSSVHNTDISFILKNRQIPIVCFHFCIFKSTFFSYINSFFSKTNFYLYITQILFENTFLQIKIRSFVLFYLYIYTEYHWYWKKHYSLWKYFQINGPPLRCKSQPSYVHPSLSVHKYSFVYIFTSWYTFKLVNNQVTLVSKRSFHRHLFIFPS